jgi:hypothetical protein
MVVDIEAVTLRTRWLAILTTGTFRTPLSALAVAYPIRNRVGRRGVGLTTTDGQTAYFWAGYLQEEILRTLAAGGVTVDPVRRRHALFRPQGSPGPSVTQVVELRPWLARTLPLFMILLTVATVLELGSSPASPRLVAYATAVWGIAVWGIVEIAMFRLWRGSRRRV